MPGSPRFCRACDGMPGRIWNLWSNNTLGLCQITHSGCYITPYITSSACYIQLVTPIIDATRATCLGAAFAGNLKLIGVRLPLGLNWCQFKIHSCLCASMRNAHRRSAVALGPAKPGETSQNLGNHPKTAKNWFLNCCHVVSDCLSLDPSMA